MYPDPPYPGFSWAMNHHMGVVDPKNLYYILQAAELHSASADPSADINSYLIANKLLTPNIRTDSGQPDAWRDYQQILSELGLIFSSRYLRKITLTPLGMSLLDGSLGFSEIMTLQAFRYQYPNGHKTTIDTKLKNQLQNTQFSQVKTLAEVQQAAGVQIRPTVLIWQILSILRELGESPYLTIAEIQTYLLRCATHSDTASCVTALVNARNNALNSMRLTPIGIPRDVQEWIRFLVATPLFEFQRNKGWLVQSAHGLANAGDIDTMCNDLVQSNSFWKFTTMNRDASMEWYAYFGELNLAITLTPEIVQANSQTLPSEDFVGGRETEADKLLDLNASGGKIRLRDFDAAALLSPDAASRIPSGTTIESSYDAALADQMHRTHDSMVILIANICRAKGARVMDDPKSVDLLVEYNQEEFIIEVKSVTPRNFVGQLRYAVGQVLQYDYLRSKQTTVPRRKIIAVAAQVPDKFWCIPFLNDHLNMDLLSLQGRGLKIDSHAIIANELFT